MNELYNAPRTVKIAWYAAGEGYYGDYDEEDPTDRELLRFDLYVLRHVETGAVPDGDESYLIYPQKNIGDLSSYEVVGVPDSERAQYGWDNIESYCTLVPVSASAAEREALLKILMNKLEDAALSNQGKHPAEEASWISLSWIKDSKRFTQMFGEDLSRQILIDLGWDKDQIEELSDGDMQAIADTWTEDLFIKDVIEPFLKRLCVVPTE